MAFTEFCCRASGSNLNAGTRTGSSTEPGTSPDFTYASGNWVAGTGVFTVASGDPASDGVAVGDFASVYPNGSTVAVFIGRVTARDATTITVSLTVKSGTAPTDGTGDRTLRIGGAWAGPNAAVTFPATFVTSTLTNASGHLPRINYKNDQTYSITAALSGVGASTRHQGYTATYEDFGKFIVDGGTSGVSFNLWGVTVGANASLADCICRNNGATGSAAGIFWNSAGGIVERVVCHSVRGTGFQSNTSTTFRECESYSFNQSNTAGLAGFVQGGSGWADSCIAHDGTGANNTGFSLAAMSVVSRCIADTIGGVGFSIAANGAAMLGCDAYNNGSHGVSIVGGISVSILNTNLVKNGGHGISGTSAVNGTVLNCGFGAGTQANTSGQTSLASSVMVSGSVSYASDITPWTDPANGDFRISLASAKAAGRGSFLQTAASYAGTVGYPDIGAGQSAGGGSVPSFGFASTSGPSFRGLA